MFMYQWVKTLICRTMWLWSMVIYLFFPTCQFLTSSVLPQTISSEYVLAVQTNAKALILYMYSNKLFQWQLLGNLTHILQYSDHTEKQCLCPVTINLTRLQGWYFCSKDSVEQLNCCAVKTTFNFVISSQPCCHKGLKFQCYSSSTLSVTFNTIPA